MDFYLHESLGFIIRRTSGKIKSEMLNRFRRWDITPEQWAFIRFLWDQDGLTPQQLSDISCKDRPNTLRIIGKLEQKELVLRVPCPQDRRASQVFLTAKGRNVKVELDPVLQDLLENALGGISFAQQEELKAALNRIYQNLG